MHITTGPLLVVGYDEWEVNGEKATRADGSNVEYVQLLDKESSDVRNWTMDASINGSRPPELTFVQVEARMSLQSKVSGRGENARAVAKERFTVTAFKPIRGGSTPAAAADKPAA